MKKYNKKLGTSKREQGIWTPPAPQHPKRRAQFFKDQAIRDKIEEGTWWERIWYKMVQKFNQRSKHGNQRHCKSCA